MKLALIILLLISTLTFSQQQDKADAGEGGTPSVISPANELVGNWINEMPLFELYGNMYEKGAIKVDRYKDTPFIENIVFKSDNKGFFKFAEKEEAQDFEYQIRENNVLVIAYGSLLNPKIDMYKYYKTSEGNIFLYSTKLSFTIGKFYLYLIRDKSGIMGQSTSQNK